MKALNDIFKYAPEVESCLRRNGKVVKGPTVFIKHTSTILPNNFLRVEEVIWLLFGKSLNTGFRVVKITKNCKPTIENLTEINIEDAQGEINLDCFIPSNISKSGLVWNKHRISTLGNVLVYPNDTAGTLDGRGYYSINLNNKSHKIHRLLWEIYFGPIPNGHVIDHIDGDKQNNSINNLRCVLPSKNARNSNYPNKSGSGIIGVHTYKREGVLFGYRVGWQDWLSGKPVGKLKYFRFTDYGDKAFEKACEFREAKILELNSLGYGYTTRHGYKENK